MNRGAKTKQLIRKKFSYRVFMVILFFALAAIALLARAVQLQVFNTEFLNQQADTRHGRKRSQHIAVR